MLRELSSIIEMWNFGGAGRIEPTHKGFADLSLTTWVPRLVQVRLTLVSKRLNLTAEEV